MRRQQYNPHPPPPPPAKKKKKLLVSVEKGSVVPSYRSAEGLPMSSVSCYCSC